MIRKLHNTLSGLLVIGSFLALILLLAQPLPAANPAGAFGARQAVPAAAQRIEVTIDLDDGLGLRKLNLTLPYFAIDRLLVTRTDS